MNIFKGINWRFYFLLMPFSISAKAQEFRDAAMLAAFVQQHSFHCDTAIKRFELFFRHDEQPLKLTYIRIDQVLDSLLLSGRLVDPFGEGVEVRFFHARLKDSLCDVGALLVTTDKNGRFAFKIHIEEKESLWMLSPGFRPMSLSLPRLRNFVKQQ